MARAAAWVRSSTPSYARIELTSFLTVPSERNSLAVMSPFTTLEDVQVGNDSIAFSRRIETAQSR